MFKGNRLINGFKQLNKKNIWKHLNALAENYIVYSEHFTGLGPHLRNNNIYIYVYHTSMVVVCFDNATLTDELADEERFNQEEPLYFTSTSHRVSPVWQLAETIKMIKKGLEEVDEPWPVWGVLLTESNFINSNDMQEIWEEMGVTVIDNLKRLAQKKIEVNQDEDALYNSCVRDVIADLRVPVTPESQEPEPQEPESDNEEEDFMKLLEKFLTDHEDSDHDDEESGDDDDELDEQDEEKDEEEKDDDDDEDEEATGPFGDNPDSSDDDDDLPSGVVEQNLNLSVKVRILSPMEHPRAELDKLVGCADIKARLDELLALTRYNTMLSKAFPDVKRHEVSLHSIFFGRPGTGKTTVCKIFGSLLHEAGALSKGHVVVADRSTFIGTLWGDEERSVKQILEQARGGVLMIDEAYLLNGKHDHDPGRLVIQLLMEVLADETQRDLAVVLCGYKEPMMELLDSNPGLHSRFPNRFEFNDFTVDELLEITRRRISEYRYRFTDPAWQKFKEVLIDAYQRRDPQSWGNARFVANQLERIYILHAQRCVRECPSDSDQLLTLTTADILPIDVARPRPRIGFRAA
jgi:hypothetical protein